MGRWLDHRRAWICGRVSLGWIMYAPGSVLKKIIKKNVGTRCAEEHHDAEHRPFFSLDQLHYSISASVVLCSRFVVRGIYGPLVVHLYIKGISQEPKIINYCQGAGWTGLSISVLGGLLWNNMTWRCRRQHKT